MEKRRKLLAQRRELAQRAHMKNLSPVARGPTRLGPRKPDAVAAALAALLVAVFGLTAARADGGAPPKFDGWRGPKPQIDCACRRPGGDKTPLGAVACLRKDGQWRLARCDMPQNLPVWRFLDETCSRRQPNS